MGLLKIKKKPLKFKNGFSTSQIKFFNYFWMLFGQSGNFVLGTFILTCLLRANVRTTVRRTMRPMRVFRPQRWVSKMQHNNIIQSCLFILAISPKHKRSHYTVQWFGRKAILLYDASICNILAVPIGIYVYIICIICV